MCSSSANQNQHAVLLNGVGPKNKKTLFHVQSFSLFLRPYRIQGARFIGCSLQDFLEEFAAIFHRLIGPEMDLIRMGAGAVGWDGTQRQKEKEKKEIKRQVEQLKEEIEEYKKKSVGAVREKKW